MPDSKIPLNRMYLHVLLPTEVLIEETVVKIIAEASNGSFCLLPRHIDFAAPLVPGVLIFLLEDGTERFAAIDEGVLIKCAQDVFVSTRNGAFGKHLGELQALVDERFLDLDEHERRARSALASLEAGVLKQFRELQEQMRG